MPTGNERLARADIDADYIGIQHQPRRALYVPVFPPAMASNTRADTGPQASRGSNRGCLASVPRDYALARYI